MKNHDCTKCIHAIKLAEHEWECDAEDYDLKHFTCFIPKDESNKTEA